MLLALIFAPSFAMADAKEKLIATIKTNYEKGEKKAAALRSELELMKAGRVSRGLDEPFTRLELPNGKVRYGYRSPKDKSDLISRIENQINAATTRDRLLPVLSMRGNVGDVGRLPGPKDLERDEQGRLPAHSFKVRQVVAADAALVAWQTYYITTETPSSLPDHETVIWLGIETSNLADGEVISIPGIWEVIGNRTYTTAIGGSKTVYEYRRVNDKGVWEEALADKPAIPIGK
jgi:hypothetical protein